MSTPAGAKEINPYRRPMLSGLEGTAPYNRLKAAGEMGSLAVRSIRTAITPPFHWWRDAVQQVSISFRRCAIPLIISHSIYLVAFGVILFGGIAANLGLAERHAGLMSLIWSREISTWITGMIFAGIAGSAITADLGARKIREELDALTVLGVQQTRALLVPRVIACTLAMPALALLSVGVVDLVEFAVVPSYFHVAPNIELNGLKAIILPSDILYATLLKNVVLGFFVGVVACYKGVSSGAGAESVGRAVNQTVVVTFFGIWLFNSLFNFAYFTLFPGVLTLRG
ncbi:MAG: MlaE family ABC transporter permease [Solirubrobacteraceae bacterium]